MAQWSSTSSPPSGAPSTPLSILSCEGQGHGPPQSLSRHHRFPAAPWPARDITAELREALLSRREDKEAETGHPLTRGEEEDLLRAFGHPLVVAARYGRQHYLVGPELYPLYVFALKILLAIIAGSAVITGIVNAAVGPGQPGAAIATALAVL